MNSVFTGETQEMPPWNIAHRFWKGKLICVMRKHSHISGNKYISLWENGDHHAFQSFKHSKHVIFYSFHFIIIFFYLKHACIAETVVLLVRYLPSLAVFELPLLSIRTAFSAKIRNEFWKRGYCNLPNENSVFIIQYEHNVMNASYLHQM